jgi:hypothetical protein
MVDSLNREMGLFYYLFEDRGPFGFRQRSHTGFQLFEIGRGFETFDSDRRHDLTNWRGSSGIGNWILKVQKRN